MVTMADWQVITGDCLDVMRGMEPGSVDAVITDPPYGIGYSPSQNTNTAWGPKTFTGDTVVQNDDKAFDPYPWLTFPTVVLFGAQNYAHLLPPSRGWLVWDKRDGISSNDFGDCEIAWTNIDQVTRLFRHYWSGALRASERGEARVHPTQKPIALMRWCIELATQPGATILDPFCGGGTTGVACMQTGRNFIGIEIDPGYADIARARIEHAAEQARQLRLV